MQILKYMLGVMLVLLAASPSFAYTTLDDLKFGEYKYKSCYVMADESKSYQGNCLEDTLKSLKPGMWGVPGLDDKTQVDIIGNSVCVDYRGKQDPGQAADNQSYFDKPSDGGVCYCKMTGPETSSWMFEYEFKDYKGCNAVCAEECVKWIDSDTSKIRTNMFATVDYGGGSSGGVDYSWLYGTTGTGNMCYVGPGGKFADNGCPSGTDKIITEPRQWAAVLDSKEHPQTLVTGTAWVSNVMDTDKYVIGYIPTDSKKIDEINHEYESYKPGDNPYGKYCYCKMETPGESSWVLVSANMYLDACTERCPNYTTKRGGDSFVDTFTDAMFSTLKSAAGGMSMVVTTQKYVDDLLSTKQAFITTIGTNKLMTFGSSAGNIVARDIVSMINKNTSPTTVLTVGPIVAAVDNKQDAVNGTANYVMTGTGTAGTLGEKPVYSTTNNYSNALITAGTINAAAATAANSELTCTRYVDGAPQTDANCLLWGMNTTAPTALALYREFNLTEIFTHGIEDSGWVDIYGNLIGSAGDYGLTSADVNRFVVAFDSGDILKGEAQCDSNIVGWASEIGHPIIDNPTGTGRSCFCRLYEYDQPGGSQSISSRWVFAEGTDDPYECRQTCPSYCLMEFDGMESAMISAVQ